MHELLVVLVVCMSLPLHDSHVEISSPSQIKHFKVEVPGRFNRQCKKIVVCSKKIYQEKKK